MKSFASLLLAMLVGTVAMAQPRPDTGPNPANRFVRIAGTLTAISADGLKVRDAAGHEVSLGVGPAVSVVATRSVARDSIKPGDFVASANLNQADGVGRSLEMRLFEPGSHAGEGSRPMTQPGAAPGQMMTNATVTHAAQTKAGLELDVQYPGGVRHLIVPPDVPIIGYLPVEASTLKVGTAVTALAVRGSDGVLRTSRIQIAAPSATP